MIRDIVQIKLSPAKVLIGFDHDRFLARLIELGDDYLEENRIFCFLFDTTPQDKIISDMKSYEEIIDAFPDSNRVANKALYIGNYAKEDWEGLANQCLSGWMGNYEIMEIVK